MRLDEEVGREEGEVEEEIVVEAGDGGDVVEVVTIDAGDEVDVGGLRMGVGWGKVPSCMVSLGDRVCAGGKRGVGETWGGSVREVRSAPGSVPCVKAMGSGEGVPTYSAM